MSEERSFQGSEMHKRSLATKIKTKFGNGILSLTILGNRSRIEVPIEGSRVLPSERIFYVDFPFRVLGLDGRRVRQPVRRTRNA